MVVICPVCRKVVVLSAINIHLDKECGRSQAVANRRNIVQAGHSGNNVTGALEKTKPPVGSSATTATNNTGVSGTESNLLQLDRN